MKNKIKLIITALLLAFVSFAFVQANLNPFNWAIEVRAGMIILVAFASFMILSYPNDI